MGKSIMLESIKGLLNLSAAVLLQILYRFLLRSKQSSGKAAVRGCAYEDRGDGIKYALLQDYKLWEIASNQE